MKNLSKGLNLRLKYIVRIEPDAQNDLEEAVIWYEEERKNLGKDFSEEVYLKIESIIQNPKLYQATFKNIRTAVLDQFPFSIFYFMKNKIYPHNRNYPPK